MKPFVGLLLALLVGVSMAFFKPMKPIQVMDGSLDGVEPTTFFGLDNPGVRSDDKITPARKCTLGFCVEGVLTSSFNRKTISFPCSHGAAWQERCCDYAVSCPVSHTLLFLFL